VCKEKGEKMDKKCVSCKKRGCPVKKIDKLERNLMKWFKAEKLSLPDGALLTEKCLDKLVEKILSERKKDRDAITLLRMRRADREIKREIDEEIDDEIDDEMSDEVHRKFRKNGKENKERLWYIG